MDFNRVAERVIAFEDDQKISRETPRQAQLLSDKTVHVLVNRKHSHLLDFETAQAATIARNLIHSGSAREALQSVNRSGSANPLEAKMHGPSGW